jgi:hypothetical protein
MGCRTGLAAGCAWDKRARVQAIAFEPNHKLQLTACQPTPTKTIERPAPSPLRGPRSENIRMTPMSFRR